MMGRMAILGFLQKLISEIFQLVMKFQPSFAVIEFGCPSEFAYFPINHSNRDLLCPLDAP